MDTRELVEEKRKEGEQLLRALDAAGFPVSAAFWYRMQETNDWRLIIASPTVRDQGPDFAYQNIQRALSQLSNPTVQLTDIWVVKDTEPLAQLIKSDKRTGPREISNLRYYNTSVSGAYIDAAYVYRST